MDKEKKKEQWSHIQKRVYPTERETFFRDGLDKPEKTPEKKRKEP